MIKNLLLLFGFTCQLGFAQFAGPNASTYNPATKKYYITNYYGKNMISLDENNKKDTFIKNLNSPNNILFEKLPLGSAFIILDSNEVKAYDSAGNFYAKFTTSGAIKLQDAVFNKSTNTLYISDVVRGVIYKTTFGPAPFYLPTTSVFSTPFRRPSAMVLQASKNRILYVEDTLGGNLMSLNLTTGNTALLKSLNMDNLVGLAEDGQGNLYLSSQGLKAIYQLNKYYVGSPKKLYTEPKPGDLFVNIPKDQWVYTCIQCGTVYTPPLHSFGPGLEIMGCPGDSFNYYKNYLHNNIGTFEPGNSFVMEMSNSSGSFAQSTTLAIVTDTLIPAEIKGIIPPVAQPGTGYKIRWRSTKPAVNGTLELMHIYSNPFAEASSKDTIEFCSGNTVVLGANNPKAAGLEYSWTPANVVDSATNHSVKANVNSGTTIYLHVKNSDGCKNNDSVFILPVSSLNPGFIKDTLSYCKGDSAYLGTKAVDGIQYNWSPGNLLTDSTKANPVYIANESRLFNLTFSSNGGCIGTKSQFVQVNEYPKFTLLSDTQYICKNDVFENKVVIENSDTQVLVQWYKKSSIDTGIASLFSQTDSGKTFVTLINSGKCKSYTYFHLYVYPETNPKLTIVSDSIAQTDNSIDNVLWYRNDTLLTDTGFQITMIENGNYKACGKTQFGCMECTNAVLFMKKQTNHTHLLKNQFQIAPNPVTDVIYIQGEQKVLNWKLISPDGRVLENGKGTEIQMKDYAEGVYLLQINNQRLLIYKIQ